MPMHSDKKKYLTEMFNGTQQHILETLITLLSRDTHYLLSMLRSDFFQQVKRTAKPFRDL